MMKSPFTFVHKKATGEGKQPAIFLLHGLGSDEKDLFQLVSAFEGQAHIFSLQGPVKHKPGYAFYTFEEEGFPQRAIFDKVLKAIEAFIMEAIQVFDLDAEQIYVVGFNQGAVMAQSLATIMGNAIRGTAALSGFMPEFVALEYSKVPMNQSKIFISHGEYDYVYPLTWGERSAAFFTEYGTDLTFKIYADGHGVTAENLQDLEAFITADFPKVIH